MCAVVNIKVEPDDNVMVRKCLNNDTMAFEYLVKKYLKPIYNYIVQYVQDASLSEDLAQETFIRAYRSLHRFDPNRPFKPWLFTIATNVSKSALKKSKPYELLLHYESHSLNLLENLDEGAMEEIKIKDDNLTALVHEALKKLSPSVRQAIILRHVHDLPYETVAQIMQANINSVRTWLKRGRTSLKIILEQNGGLNLYDK